MTKTTHQNTAFSPLFRKKCKDRLCNKLNINTLHFCILHFAMNGCADCSVASPSKKGKGKNLVLHTQAENGFFPFWFLTMLFLTGL